MPEQQLTETDLESIERQVMAVDWIGVAEVLEGRVRLSDYQVLQDLGEHVLTLLAEVRRLRQVLDEADDLICEAACLTDPDIVVREDVAAETRRRLADWVLRDVPGVGQTVEVM